MPKATTITSEQLWVYMATHREDEYVLVDVREVEEYRAGHIPGAKLYPLSDFDLRIGDLTRLEGKDLVFYCRSGRRSLRAANLAVEGLGLSNVHHLAGGILAWQDQIVPEPPMLAVLEPASPRELLDRSLGLEKGAHELYSYLASRAGVGPLGDVARELAGDEMIHARAVHRILAGPHSSEAEFREAFEHADGRLVESGEEVDELVSRVMAAGAPGAGALLELALEIELRAYDLYKTLATQTSGLTLDVLLELAQHEKRHVAAVARRLAPLTPAATP